MADRIKTAYRTSKNYYDDALTGQTWWAKVYINFFWGASVWEITPLLFAELGEGFSGKLLDVPVDTALFTAEHYKRLRNAEITALDYSEDMLVQAKSRLDGLPNVTCIQGDVSKLVFDDETFDAVLSMNGFHVFPDKDTAFRETARV